MRKLPAAQGGFTLLELLIVIVAVIILIAVTLLAKG